MRNSNLYFFSYNYRILFTLIGLLLLLLGCDHVVKDDELPDLARELRLTTDRRIMALNQRIGLSDVLNNDIIPEIATLSFGTPSHGLLMPDSYQYVPEANFIGTDSLLYTVCVEGDCKSAFVLLTIKDSVVSNCYSIPYPDEVTLLKDSEVRYPVYLNDEVCGRFEVALAIRPMFGEASVDQQQRLVYRPYRGFIGTDSLLYYLYQGTGASASWVRLHVNRDPNDATTPNYCTLQDATPDSASVSVSDSVSIDLLANDMVCNNLCTNPRAELLSQLGPGIAQIAADGRTLRYKAPNVNGSVAQFQYRVCATCSAQPVCVESHVYIRTK